MAYLYWRRFDPQGPRISAGTWDREVAAVNGFYRWQVRAGHVHVNPIPQRDRRQVPIDAGRHRRDMAGVVCQTPATYSHGAGRERSEWFPAASYRRWRDVGVRGYTVDGLPDPGFRGRWAARNATFCDLMVRTGLRLAEQTALAVFDIPADRTATGYQRFWLPPAVVKGGSARWVYVPASVIGERTSVEGTQHLLRTSLRPVPRSRCSAYHHLPHVINIDKRAFRPSRRDSAADRRLAHGWRTTKNQNAHKPKITDVCLDPDNRPHGFEIKERRRSTVKHKHCPQCG